MSEQTPEINQENLEAKIIARAWKSEEYKQELLNDPKAVIEREFNIQIPEEVTVQILEETPTNLYFVMPMRPVIPEADLDNISEEELQAIAGGIAGKIEFSKGAIAGIVAVSYDQWRKYNNL
ncbi:NHLP leader peptide family RiPP precursor [Cylindrospermum sp. FACHB-282]|uniref:NHLP leader peptide family RiPP precursor n=1 Tax=Cylindrospermum sp. FACHB-282 TaxID=2692794 RepID=UPI001685647B|nr:NHLP leader peptide family RiPP precursor [Cylindrospermum sp. FACHB-282]MBD2387098.1 NHLP leader peptide family natural product precursor [Cylindrospermum sp. FACHB-282]